MKRKTRRRNRPPADINITNLIDVTMTLLVVFMIVAPLLTQGLQIELAESKVVETIEAEEEAILVEIDQNMILRVNKDTEAVMGSGLVDLLKELKANLGDVPVQVRADKRLSWGDVAGLYGYIREAGFEEINAELVAEEIEY